MVGYAGDVTELSRRNARDGRTLLVSGSDDVTTQHWDSGTGEEINESVDSLLLGIPAKREATFTNAYDRTLLVTPGGNNVKTTDYAADEGVRTPLRGHSFQVTAVSSFYGPAGRLLLAFVSRDHTTRIWDPTSKSRPAARFVKQPNEAQVITRFIAADGSPQVGAIRSIHNDVLQIWETDMGQWVGKLDARLGQLWIEAHSVWFTARQCSQMLAITEQESLRIWGLDSGQFVGEPLTECVARINDIPGWTIPFREIRLAIISDDGNIRFWDPVKGTQIGRSFTGHIGSVRALCTFSTRHGDAWLAPTGDEGVICIWDSDVGRPIGRPLKEPPCPMTYAVAFSAANGKPRLVTTGDDCIVRVWDPGNERQLS